GVLWEATDKKLQLVATDGHRLAQAKGPLSEAAAQEVTAIVPGKLMGLINRVATEEEQTLAVRIQDSQILVRSAGVVLVSSLVQGNFPKYSDVIPKETTVKATVNTGQVEHRIRQAALLTTEESRGVRLSFQPEQVTLTSRAPEAGEAEVSCPIQLEGDPLDIAFNPAFLLDALKVADSDQISFELNAGNKPAVIRSGTEFLYVLMPVDTH
ncbi:MAG: DNA polymerase III subunit beta, partial [Planctomycetota bacterium]